MRAWVVMNTGNLLAKPTLNSLSYIHTNFFFSSALTCLTPPLHLWAGTDMFVTAMTVVGKNTCVSLIKNSYELV